MEIEIKRISMDTIKPSSPTPKSLQKHHLSCHDQSMMPVFAPTVYFYESNPKIPNSEKLKQLKKSLSEVLSIFYPVAGRLVGNHYVDCNDSGAPFSEAEANCRISQVLPNPHHNTMAKFLPNYKLDEPQDFILAVQATFFCCGGLALGILFSHKVADGFSVTTFFNAWAAAAGGYGDSPTPKFDVAAYFPPLQDTSGLDPAMSMTKEDIDTRVITFPATRIAGLRERYAVGGQRPSRVEGVTAFIWSQFLSATGARSDPSKMYAMTHWINIRRRVKPALSEYHFGNVLGSSATVLAAEDGGVEVVERVRESLKSVDSGFVASREMSEFVGNEMLVFISFSSLCRFPLYEADFGWGKPIWVGLGRFPYKNMVFLTDTKSGSGIEALVHLTKEVMVKFEANLEAEMQLLKSNL